MAIKVYKKQIRYILERGDENGFATEIIKLTDWQDEDEAPSLEEMRAKHNEKYGWVTAAEKFVDFGWISKQDKTEAL